MIATIIAIAAKIGAVLVKAIKVIATVSTIASKILAAPAKIAGAIAIKAGVSAATAAKVVTTAKVSTAVLANTMIRRATDQMPQAAAVPIRLLSDITIGRMLTFKII